MEHFPGEWRLSHQNLKSIVRRWYWIEWDNKTKSTSTYKRMQIISKTDNRQPHPCAYHLTIEDIKTRTIPCNAHMITNLQCYQSRWEVDLRDLLQSLLAWIGHYLHFWQQWLLGRRQWRIRFEMDCQHQVTERSQNNSWFLFYYCINRMKIITYVNF